MFEIGATLREARERRHLTFDQVEAETKIRAKYVRALEEEQFDILPSGTYVKGFLRTYADSLGLQGQMFVDEYVSRFGTKHDDDLFRRRRERMQANRRESSNALVIAIVAVVALSVLIFVAWRWGPASPPPLVPPAASATSTDALPNNPAAKAFPTSTDGAAPSDAELRVKVSKVGGFLEITRLSDSKHPILSCRKTCDAVDRAFTATDKQGFTVNVGHPDEVKVWLNGKRIDLAGSNLVTVGPNGVIPPSAG